MTQPALLTVDPARLAERTPSVYAALATAWSTAVAALGEGAIRSIQRRTEEILIGSTRVESPTPGAQPGAEDTRLLALVDQFVDYVPDVDDTLLDPVRAAFGPERIREVVEGVYVADQLTRLYIAHSRLFGIDATADGERSNHAESATLRRATAQWHDRVLQLDWLDPTTSEVNRLRGAFYHTCRLCMSGRFVLDGQPIADVGLVTAVRDRQTSALDARHRVALMYADAHMADPARYLDGPLVDLLTQTFSTEELIEITLDMSAWNIQKVHVALGIDDPVHSGQLTAMWTDESGRVKFGQPLGPAT